MADCRFSLFSRMFNAPFHEFLGHSLAVNFNIYFNSIVQSFLYCFQRLSAFDLIKTIKKIFLTVLLQKLTVALLRLSRSFSNQFHHSVPFLLVGNELKSNLPLFNLDLSLLPSLEHKYLCHLQV